MKTELLEKILQLRSQGRAHHEIAQITGFCTRTVGRVLQKYSHEFALHEADVMKMAFEKSGVGPQARAFYEAAYLRRIEEEFNSRPLSDVPTPTLAKMVLAARNRSDQYRAQVKRNADESMLQSEEVIFTEEDEHPIREPQQDTRTGSAQFAGTHQPPTLPKPIPSPVPAPTVAQTAAPVPEKESKPKAERMEPEQNEPEATIPEGRSPEVRAKCQKKLLDEVKQLAQELKTIVQLKNPNPSTKGGTSQKEAT